jgi:hypothetical protein
MGRPDAFRTGHRVGPAGVENARASFARVYTNFMPADEGQWRVDENYGSNLQKLSEVKGKYDPTNLFRLNANILPANPPLIASRTRRIPRSRGGE